MQNIPTFATSAKYPFVPTFSLLKQASQIQQPTHVTDT